MDFERFMREVNSGNSGNVFDQAVDAGIVQPLTAEEKLLARDKNKFMMILVDDAEFASIANGKIDFALELEDECDACLPERGDGVVFMVPADNNDAAGIIVVDILFSEICEVGDLPADLWREYTTAKENAGIEEKVGRITFRINSDLTLLANQNGIELGN